MNRIYFAGTLSALLLTLSALSAPAFAAGVTDNLNDSSVAVYQTEDSPAAGALVIPDENAPILKDVRAAEQSGQTLLVKTWEIPPDYDPERLAEADFEKNGLRYKEAYLLQVSENIDRQTKLASETVTVSHARKEDAVAAFQPIIEYAKDGFSGQLTLKPDGIVTEAADQRSYSYAVTDTREFTGFERNDTCNIPKTVTKNGVTLTLADVNWRQTGESNYTAAAHYRGTASGTNVSQYVSTATYIGEVSKEALGSVTYAVVYEGSPIPPAPFDFSPYLIAGGAAILALTALLVFLSRRKNTKVYAMTGKEYQLVHRQRVSALAPIIDLTPPEISSGSEEFMIVMDRLAAGKMKGQLIKIVGKDGVIKEQRVTGVRHFHIRPNTMNEEESDHDYQG